MTYKWSKWLVQPNKQQISIFAVHSIMLIHLFISNVSTIHFLIIVDVLRRKMTINSAFVQNWKSKVHFVSLVNMDTSGRSGMYSHKTLLFDLISLSNESTVLLLNHHTINLSVFFFQIRLLWWILQLHHPSNVKI